MFMSLFQECFNSPYGTSFFSTYAEKMPGESTRVLSEVAKENEIYLVGGKTTRVVVERHKKIRNKKIRLAWLAEPSTHYVTEKQ